MLSKPLKTPNMSRYDNRKLLTARICQKSHSTTEDPSEIQHSTGWDGRVGGSSTGGQSYGKERYVLATPLSHAEDGQLMTPAAPKSTTDESARNISNLVELPVFPPQGGHRAPLNPAQCPTLQAEWKTQHTRMKRKAQLFADGHGSMQIETTLS